MCTRLFLLFYFIFCIPLILLIVFYSSLNCLKIDIFLKKKYFINIFLIELKYTEFVV